MIFYVFGDAIDLEFGLMNFDLWIGCRNCINLTVSGFLFEDRSFPNINCELDLACGLMGGYQFLFEFAFFYHEFKIYIDILAGCKIVGFFLLFFLFGLFHLNPSLFSFLLNLLDRLHEFVLYLFKECNLNIQKFI
jgi:hypothetical protein